MYIISESDDYEKLSCLFNENGLEIDAGIRRPHNVVKCWECRDITSNKLIGGASLEIRSGYFVVADVAVDIDYRKEKIGTQLMSIMEDEIIKQGGSEAWLVGKVPEFYIKIGWEIVDRDQAPNISKCFTCDKFGTECFAEVMRKTLVKA
ncbi:MAG: GNAT family N-acetyltransferase [Eubacteriales bacterium]|nr:GNAT family N-acetyltransferase [Eubacteriales bacterium]